MVPMRTKSGGKPTALHNLRCPNLRWKIIGMILLATTINYIDRDALSVAEPYIRREFNLTPKDYGEIVSWFLLAYAAMQLIAGRLIDRVGTRLGFTISIIWWSCANMLHGLATGATSLAGYRFLLGIGEAGNFPAALKAIAEWFPPAERAKAVGILSAGPGLGSMIAKPLVAWLVLSYGWRWSFVVTGALGLLWLCGWRALYWSPHEHPRITDKEAALLSNAETADDTVPMPWLNFLRYRAMWGLMLARFISDGAFYFFVFWLPKYLNEARGFDLKQIGMFAWLPFLASDLGGLTGGWLGAWLAARGWSWSAARQMAGFVVVVRSCVRRECAICRDGVGGDCRGDVRYATESGGVVHDSRRPLSRAKRSHRLGLIWRGGQLRRDAVSTLRRRRRANARLRARVRHRRGGAFVVGGVDYCAVAFSAQSVRSPTVREG